LLDIGYALYYYPSIVDRLIYCSHVKIDFMKPVTNNKKLNAKDRILKAATTVFSQRGYSEATISEIAREAGVSDASVYQHFAGKEELFVAVGSQRVINGLPLMEEQLFGVKGALGKLRKFFWVYARYLMEDKEVTKIVLLHLKTSKMFLATDAYKDVQRLYGKITEIIESGQRSGEIRPGINAHTARSLLIGSLEHLLIRWLLKDCSYDLWPYIEEAYELIESSLRETPNVRIHVSYEIPGGAVNPIDGQTTGTKKQERAQTTPKRLPKAGRQSRKRENKS
jgi:TetR/AcrR family fatty acid metabolism transcriptional regulator